MKKIIIVIMLVFSLMLLVSCAQLELPQEPDQTPETIGTEDVVENTEEKSAPAEEDVIEEVIEEELEVLCSSDDECEWNEYCINGECSQLTQVYDTEGDCESKCNFDEIVISTSDDQEFTLSRGKGSYTSAGALEWKLMGGADYCLGEEDTVVAVQLLKKNLGEIVETQVITLEVGEESETITHPNLASVEFSMTVESINEQCS